MLAFFSSSSPLPSTKVDGSYSAKITLIMPVSIIHCTQVFFPESLSPHGSSEEYIVLPERFCFAFRAFSMAISSACFWG